MNIKLVIAIIGSLAIIVVAVLFMSWLKGNTKPKAKATTDKNDAAKESSEEETAKNKDDSTQMLFPAADIKGPVLLQKDGTALSYVKVRCVNSALLSTEELIKHTETVAIAISGQRSGFKIIHIQRPVDTTELIASYDKKSREYQDQISLLNVQVKSQARKKEELVKKIRLLENLKRVAEFEVSKNSHMRSEVYVVFPASKSTNNEEEAYQRARKFCERLKDVGLSGHTLFCEEIVGLLLAFLGDFRTSSEHTNPHLVGTLVDGIHNIKREDEEDELIIA